MDTPGFDTNLAGSVSIYPNTVVDFINVTVDNNEAVDYRFFDCNGFEMISKTGYTKGIDVHSLASLMYFIQFYIKDQTQTYKFVK